MAEPLRLLGEEIRLISWGPRCKRLSGPKHWSSRWRKCPGLLRLRWCIENVPSATNYVIATASIRRICCERSVFLNYMVYMHNSFLVFVFSKYIIETPNRVNLAATASQLSCVHFSVHLCILINSTGQSGIFLGFSLCHNWRSQVCVCSPTGLSAFKVVSRHFNRETATYGQLRK